MLSYWLKQTIRDYPRRLRRCSWLLLAEADALVLIGVVFVYGAGQQTGGSFATLWQRQLLWSGVGLIVMLALVAIDYRWLGRTWYIWYGGSLALLALVLLIGSEINNAKSWLVLAPGITIQPSEFAKLGLIVAICHYASRRSIRFDHLYLTIPVFLLAALPVGLIALQPDLGSAMTLGPVVLAVLILGGLRKRWLAYAGLAVLIAAPIVYNEGLSPHQRERIRVFLDPGSNLKEGGWNAHQSLLAVGSGGFAGKGFMQGTQNTLGFLPRAVAPTDFIFSVIAEETGFLGSTMLIAIFTAMMLTTTYIATKAPDRFGTQLAGTITVLLSVHIYVNIGMTMGMAPIIGIPLPYVSYGGSFMIVMLGALGILQSVYARRPPAWGAEPTHSPAEEWYGR